MPTRATAPAATTSPRAAVFVSGAAQRLRSVASAVDATMAPGSSAAVVRGRTRAMVISPPFMVDSTACQAGAANAGVQAPFERIRRMLRSRDAPTSYEIGG